MRTPRGFGWLWPVILSLCLQACAGTFTGKLAVKGNMPFSCLTLTTNKGEMKIIGALTQKLWDCCQGRRVTVRGSIVSEGRGFMQPPELEVTEILSVGE